MSKTGERDQKRQASSYKTNKFLGCHVHHSDNKNTLLRVGKLIREIFKVLIKRKNM